MIEATTQGGFLFPFAWVFGKIIDLLFDFVSLIAKIPHLEFIANIGLCVILFTIVVRVLMLPLTIKQQRFSKLSNMMNPEIQAIQAKYKGKKDNQSVMKMQEETKLVYEKYGASPSSGCLITLIQLPIMFALYRVIYHIPGYVTKIKDLLGDVADKILGKTSALTDYVSTNGDNALTSLKDLATAATTAPEEGVAIRDVVIDKLYTINSEGWEKLSDVMGSEDIAQAGQQLGDYTNFFGISLIEAPGWRISWALIIPILAGVTQFISAKLMENSRKKSVYATNPQQDAAGSTMKVMNFIMPIMSAVFCVTFPACVGLYWITSSLVQIVQQLFINKQMKNMDLDEMVRKNLEKANAKRAKKGLPPKKIQVNGPTFAEQVKKEEDLKNRLKDRDAEVEKSTAYYNSNSNYKPGSIAAKAAMVKMFNEKNNKENNKDTKDSGNNKGNK